MIKLISVLAVAFSTATAHAGNFRDLVKGDDETRSKASLAIVLDYSTQAESIVRRALVVASEVPDPKHLTHIVKILRDPKLSDLTRQSAALTLGVIGRDFPDLWPPGNGDPAVHQPLAVFARAELIRCVGRALPTPVRRACAEAIGLARLPEGAELLRPIVDDDTEDPAVRIFSGRALSRITGEFAVSRASLAALLQQVTVVVSQP
jgi:HEAT repeat protein